MFNSEDNEDDEMFAFDEDKLYEVMKIMKNASELLETCDTDYLCEQFRKLYPPKDGIFEINEDRLIKLNSAVLSDTLQELVKQDLVDMSWSDEANDFIFSAKVIPPSGPS